MRVVVDCREIPSESSCSLAISGEEDEVLRAAVQHAMDVHGHLDSDELRDGVRAGMRPEAGGRIEGYGTAMIGRLGAASFEQMQASLEDWERQRQVPGFLAAQLLVGDDGRTVVNTAVFRDKESYQRLADDPEQDEWYRTRMAPMLDAEPQWIDGRWAVYVRQPAIVLPEQGSARATAAT